MKVIHLNLQTMTGHGVDFFVADWAKQQDMWDLDHLNTTVLPPVEDRPILRFATGQQW